VPQAAGRTSTLCFNGNAGILLPITRLPSNGNADQDFHQRPITLKVTRDGGLFCILHFTANTLDGHRLSSLHRGQILAWSLLDRKIIVCEENCSIRLPKYLCPGLSTGDTARCSGKPIWHLVHHDDQDATGVASACQAWNEL
jgi:hypothetical protein